MSAAVHDEPAGGKKMINPNELLQKGDGLLIIDVQIDFCPGGKLPVAQGDRIVPVINQWVHAARSSGIPVYASRDWHPVRHISFEERGGQWPPHCLQDSDGARFHPDLYLPQDTLIITKGVRLDHDQNSAFDETGLGFQLQHDQVKRVWVAGLALDVCVLKTVEDARRSGFSINLIKSATRAITDESGRRAVEQMTRIGAGIFEKS
jgi:nicotinamidase/pyrazinamidase